MCPIILVTQNPTHRRAESLHEHKRYSHKEALDLLQLADQATSFSPCQLWTYLNHGTAESEGAQLRWAGVE